MRIPKKLFVVLSDSHIRYEWLLLYMTRLALWLKILRHCYGVFIHFEQVLAHCESVRDSTWRNEKTFEMNKSYKNNKKIYSNLAIVLLSINKFSRHSSAISVDFKDSLFYKFYNSEQTFFLLYTIIVLHLAEIRCTFALNICLSYTDHRFGIW